jgi:hypothetical protein
VAVYQEEIAAAANALQVALTQALIALMKCQEMVAAVIVLLVPNLLIARTQALIALMSILLVAAFPAQEAAGQIAAMVWALPVQAPEIAAAVIVPAIFAACQMEIFAALMAIVVLAVAIKQLFHAALSFQPVL